MNKEKITVETEVNVPINLAWLYWTDPQYVTQWYYASEDWECPEAKNDVRTDGNFSFRMQAKSGDVGFDFEGIYSEVVEGNKITYKLADDREVSITFEDLGDKTKIVETFDPEDQNSVELQRDGWQAILNNFKKFVESTT